MAALATLATADQRFAREYTPRLCLESRRRREVRAKSAYNLGTVTSNANAIRITELGLLQLALLVKAADPDVVRRPWQHKVKHARSLGSSAPATLPLETRTGRLEGRHWRGCGRSSDQRPRRPNRRGRRGAADRLRKLSTIELAIWRHMAAGYAAVAVVDQSPSAVFLGLAGWLWPQLEASGPR